MKRAPDAPADIAVDEALVLDAWASGASLRGEATAVTIAPGERPCPRGCGALMQRLEYRDAAQLGRVLVVERCQACDVEVRGVVLELAGLSPSETRALRPSDLLRRLAADNRKPGGGAP